MYSVLRACYFLAQTETWRCCCAYVCVHAMHWRRQLWGTGARAPPLDFQLVILGITRFTDSDENVQNNTIFARFLSIFGPFLSFFCPQFSSGSNYSSQNAGAIANKFQLHTYFRFR